MSYNARGRYGSSGNEEKALDTSAPYQSRQVNSSSRPMTGYSSRFAQNNASNSDRDRSDRSRSRSPYRRRDQRSRSPYRAGRDRSRSPWRAPREKSRSPYRHPRESTTAKRQHNGDHYNTAISSDPHKHRSLYEDTNRGYDSRPPTHNGPPRGPRFDASRGVGNHRDYPDRRDRSRSPFRHPRDKDGNIISVAKSSIDEQKAAQAAAENNMAQAVDEPEEEVVKLSDAEIIEQRRKRREEIKAKHKAQAPLLVQALEQKMSAPNTPMHESSNEALNAYSPASVLDTPGATSAGSPAPFSPASFSIDTMEDIINHNETDDTIEGPSAADYDPSMDMQEDRRILQPAVKPVMPEKAVEATDVDDEYDMFAEGDNDKAADMSKLTADITQNARALDQNMLDDWDYPDGHIRVIGGELLNGKYAVQQQIGKGTFATVIRARDVSTGQIVAIKIACKNDTMYRAGTKELAFLTILNESDPEDKKHIIRLLGNFMHKGHLCLVFESLYADLRETLKRYGRYVGINLNAIRSFAHQMFQALRHLQKNEILHADLKPDNILVSERLNLIKVCDLGTATNIRDTEITPYLVSRFYRAPEVMLGMPFDYAIDMWSIGCTIFELYTGRILFAGSDNNQMLRAIQECRGKIPNRMLNKSTLSDNHFDQYGNFISIETDRVSGATAMRQPNLTKPLADKDLRSRTMASIKDSAPSTIQEAQLFADLLDKCLQLDPTRRISPVDAIQHPFMRFTKPADKKKPSGLLLPLATTRAK